MLAFRIKTKGHTHAPGRLKYLNFRLITEFQTTAKIMTFGDKASVKTVIWITFKFGLQPTNPSRANFSLDNVVLKDINFEP
ncbi:MAG: hypothetical protein OHK0047_30520 [Leptolyngbyaceae cyanobacterium]